MQIKKSLQAAYNKGDSMTQIEPIGKQPQAPIQASESEKPKRKRGRLKMMKAVSQKAPAPAEERLTAEEWEKRLKAEEEEKAKAQQQAMVKPLTREEFLAMRQAKQQQETQTTITIPNQQKPKRPSLIQRLQDNANDALGIIPTPVPAGTASQYQTSVPQNTAMPNDQLQEIDSANVSGLINNMKSNPIMAGAIALIGLLMALIGTFLKFSLATLFIEIIGLALFIFGAVFIFGHVKQMKHLKSG